MARGTLDAALIQAEMFVRLTGRLHDGGIVTLSRALAAGLAAADARARARGKPDGR